MQVRLTYHDLDPFQIADDRLIGVYGAETGKGSELSPQVVQTALEKPVGCAPLRHLISRGQKVLILVDDNTRWTPTSLVLPPLLEELAQRGIRERDIRLLVAQGTHRAMTKSEKRRKYGSAIVDKFEVMDHRGHDATALERIGCTSSGIEVWVNKEVLGADVVIGIGHIAPHRGAGFSGGAKIILPGVCGATTTGQVHWLAAQYTVEEMLGQIDNPPRRDMTEVARQVGLDFIINAVQGGQGRQLSLVSGDVQAAYQAGACLARDVLSVPVAAKADIVVVEACPQDMDFWQATKALATAGMVVKDGGVIILVSPCPEGVYPGHREAVLELGCRPYAEMAELRQRPEGADLVMAAVLAWAGDIAPGRASCIVVSDGLTRDEVERIGYQKAHSVQRALSMATDTLGAHSTIIVLRHGGELLPIVS